MAQWKGTSSHSVYVQTFLALLLPILIATALSNNATSTILSIVSFFVLFFFPGYFLLRFAGELPNDLKALVGPVFGMVTVTTIYDMFAQLSVGNYALYLALGLAIAGIVEMVRQTRPRSDPATSKRDFLGMAVAGCVAALGIALLCWRSGRFSGGDFIFYGPAGQDPLFHVTLLQRLMWHVPPDNFMASGFRAPVYHYLNDLSMALVWHFQNTFHLGRVDPFDLYYRSYPTLFYFLLGALAYRLGKRWLGSSRAGILALMVLLGGGGLGWLLGGLQTAAHGAHSAAAARGAMFSDWTSLDGIDSILPLVHRPAYYDGLLICLAVLNILLAQERSRRNWAIAGLLLGLMAGFNFTLCATIGVATVIGAVVQAARSRQQEARDLVWLALFIFLGSLPVSGVMLVSGFHYPLATEPFHRPSLDFTTTVWGGLLRHALPSSLVPWAALVMFPIVLFGLKLFGIPPMMRLDLGEDRAAIATVFAIAFATSFAIGTFLPYPGSTIAIVFLQPTLWILGLFALRPIDDWLERSARKWPRWVLWAILGMTWLQVLMAFNFAHWASFSKDTAEALWDIRRASSPGDVVAYSQSTLVEEPMLGDAALSSNFSIMAMTGLDGYYLSEGYFTPFAVPGLSGRGTTDVLAKAKGLYQQRRDDTEAFIKGTITEAGLARLAKDHVRWIVVSGEELGEGVSSERPWKKTGQLVIYQLRGE